MDGISRSKLTKPTGLTPHVALNLLSQTKFTDACLARTHTLNAKWVKWGGGAVGAASPSNPHRWHPSFSFSQGQLQHREDPVQITTNAEKRQRLLRSCVLPFSASCTSPSLSTCRSSNRGPCPWSSTPPLEFQPFLTAASRCPCLSRCPCPSPCPCPFRRPWGF